MNISTILVISHFALLLNNMNYFAKNHENKPDINLEDEEC